MVVKLVVRVEMCDMSSKVLFPEDDTTEERAALLTGIVQLVSVALKREQDADAALGRPHFMKSDKGVIGYAQTTDGFLYICESDNESESGDVLRAVVDAVHATEEEIVKRIKKVMRRRGGEIAGLWG